MNITKDVIADLFPLYLGRHCTEDTRRLVEEYLQHYPEDAAEFQRGLPPLPPPAPLPASALAEMASFQAARRRLRWRGWLMGAAIFFSCAPLSFYSANGKTGWLLREAPRDAAIYAGIAVCLWVAYVLVRRRTSDL